MKSHGVCRKRLGSLPRPAIADHDRTASKDFSRLPEGHTRPPQPGPTRYDSCPEFCRRCSLFFADSTQARSVTPDRTSASPHRVRRGDPWRETAPPLRACWDPLLFRQCPQWPGFLLCSSASTRIVRPDSAAGVDRSKRPSSFPVPKDATHAHPTLHVAGSSIAVTARRKAGRLLVERLASERHLDAYAAAADPTTP